MRDKKQVYINRKHYLIQMEREKEWKEVYGLLDTKIKGKEVLLIARRKISDDIRITCEVTEKLNLAYHGKMLFADYVEYKYIKLEQKIYDAIMRFYAISSKLEGEEESYYDHLSGVLYEKF